MDTDMKRRKMSTVATFLVAMSSTVLLSVSSKLSKKKARKPFQFKLILRKVSEEKNHLEGLGFFFKLCFNLDQFRVNIFNKGMKI